MSKINATISSIFCAIDRALNTFGQCVVQLRGIAQRDGVDITSKADVSKWLTPHVAAHYGLTKLGRDTEAANQYRQRLTKAIVGDSAPQRVAKPVRVPRELAALMAQLAAQYGKDVVREALKRA